MTKGSWGKVVLVITSFAKIYQQKKQKFEQALPLYLPNEDDNPTIISQAMRYAVLNGGKRMRPLLFMEAASLNGGGEELLPAACALEFIHCYSLVHDDLPAMDDDDLRRGMPTCHKVFGEDMAILAGDGLLTLAFELLANLDIEAASVLRAIRITGQAVGWQGMVGGQVIDLQAESQQLSADELDQLHLKKTGALIKASLQIGGILTLIPENKIAALANFGESLGLAFQIMDDVLDVIGNQQLLGKPIGSDLKNKKITYVKLYGLDQARQLATEHTDKAIIALSIFGDEADFLRQLAYAQLTRQF